MYQFCTLLSGDVFGWVACLFPQEKNGKLNPAARRQKKKSRRTADTFPRAYVAAALRKSEPPFLFAFPTMLMQSGGRYIGGYRHVNFRHSQ